MQTKEAKPSPGNEIQPGFQPYLTRNDKQAKIFIWTVSIIVFVAVAVLSKLKLNVDLGFDPQDRKSVV